MEIMTIFYKLSWHIANRRFSLGGNMEDNKFQPTISDIVGVILLVLTILMFMGFAGMFGY